MKTLNTLFVALPFILLLTFPIQAKEVVTTHYSQIEKGVREKSAELEIRIENQMLSIVNYPKGTIVTIYTVLGAKVFSEVYQGIPISLRNLKKGIYVVRIAEKTRKIVV